MGISRTAASGSFSKIEIAEISEDSSEKIAAILLKALAADEADEKA
jgi:hypothetical protein